jgi:hypothetical protein
VGQCDFSLLVLEKILVSKKSASPGKAFQEASKKPLKIQIQKHPQKSI